MTAPSAFAPFSQKGEPLVRGETQPALDSREALKTIQAVWQRTVLSPEDSSFEEMCEKFCKYPPRDKKLFDALSPYFADYWTKRTTFLYDRSICKHPLINASFEVPAEIAELHLRPISPGISPVTTMLRYHEAATPDYLGETSWFEEARALSVSPDNMPR